MKLFNLTSFAPFLALVAVACSAGESSPSAASAAATEHEIVGGTVAQAGTWPGTVAVYIDGAQGCGGTLVAPKWVVTAGHCVSSPSSENGGFDKIVAKKHKLSASGGESINVKKAYRHPDFDSSTMDNDIALLELEEESTETPVKFLQAGDVAKTLVEDAKLTVVGWGTTSEGSYSTSDDLRQVDVPFITNDTCKGFSQYEDLVDNQFCAGYTTSGKDSCQGDSGGPIYVKVGSETFQAGLVSWGIGCGRAEQPGVYTRVTSYIDWLKTTSDGAVDLGNGGGNNGGNGNGDAGAPNNDGGSNGDNDGSSNVE